MTRLSPEDRATFERIESMPEDERNAFIKRLINQEMDKGNSGLLELPDGSVVLPGESMTRSPYADMGDDESTKSRFASKQPDPDGEDISDLLTEGGKTP